MKYILTLTLLISLNALQAQSSWTLEQCVEYAYLNQETIKNNQLDEKLSDQKVRQTYTQLYPQVKGVVDVRDNIVLPTNILPGTFAGRPADQTIAVQFGQQYNATAALDANWVLYDPSVLASVKTLRQGSAISSENTEMQKRNIRFNISKSYYGAVLAQERIRLQEDLLKKNQKALEDAQTLFSNQQLSPLELHKAEWNVKNQHAEVQRAKQSLEQSLFLLKYQMGYMSDSTIVLKDPIMKDAADAREVGPATNPQNRSEYRIIKFQQQQEKLSVRKYKLSYLPSLSAYGYLGTQSFRPEFDFLSSSAKWYGVSYIGLKLTVPVFDGLLKSKQIQESRINEEKRTNELSAFEKQYQYETENSRRNVSNALQLLEIRKNNLEFAREQGKQTENRFQEGLATTKDVSDANAMIAEAQNTYLTAYHDYLVASLEYEKLK